MQILNRWNWTIFALMLGLTTPATGLSAPVNYRIDCSFQDLRTIDAACEAAAHLRNSEKRGAKESTLTVICSKSVPIYQGEAKVLLTQDLAEIQSTDQAHPTLVMPRYPLTDLVVNQVSATLNLPEGTLSGSCEVRPSVN